MDPDHITPQQATASLSNIAPFLWPFILLSLSVALTPVSPISWSYSTWLLFIIPLIITIFAPIRTFSGPLRFAYLEYASKIASLAVASLKAVVINFQSIPTLALPALFFLPVLPILFFVFFPALPVVWHFIGYHYRLRLKSIVTSVTETNASMDLALARASQALSLAHTYETQAMCTVSTIRVTPKVALSRHSADFSTPVFDDSEGHWRLKQTPGTLGADLAGKVLDTEKQMAAIEDASQRVRALSERAVAVATEGDMAVGEQLVGSALELMESVGKQVDNLLSTADQARCLWVEFRQRLTKVTTSASKTIDDMDLAVTQARRAATLAHSYEFVSKTRLSAQSPGTLGADLARKVLDTEKKMATIEDTSQGVRALSERAVAAATEGDMVVGEQLVKSTAQSMENVVKQVAKLLSTTDEAKSLWVEFYRRSTKLTTSTSTITTGLDLAVTQARRAANLAHTYEKEALAFVSETRRSASHTLALHGVGFFQTSEPVQKARQTITVDSQRVRTLGNSLAEKMVLVAAKLGDVEFEAEKIRALLVQAVTATVDGDIGTAETLTISAAEALQGVVETAQGLASTSDDVRQDWVKLSVDYWVMP